MWPPIDQLTVDGYDMTWGTNVLGTKISISESPPVLSDFFDQVLSTSRSCFFPHSSRLPFLEQSLEL